MKGLSFSKKPVKFLSLDVDGVQTDGSLFYIGSTSQAKKFNVKDGMGIKLAMRAGIHVGFISGSDNLSIITKRANVLGVKLVAVNQSDKLPALKKWIKKLNISLEEVAHIGDDVNDLSILEAVGTAICPADAADKVKSICDIVLEKGGGQGCVREYVDKYLIF